jgi:hypothetical protein
MQRSVSTLLTALLATVALAQPPGTGIAPSALAYTDLDEIRRETLEQLAKVDFDQLRQENRDKVDFDKLREENRDKVDFEQLGQENRDKSGVDFDKLREENRDKATPLSVA